MAQAFLSHGCSTYHVFILKRFALQRSLMAKAKEIHNRLHFKIHSQNSLKLIASNGYLREQERWAYPFCRCADGDRRRKEL